MNLFAPESANRLRRIGWAVLALAGGLRAWIALRGGWQFWPDEDRFEHSRQILRALLEGRLGAAGDITFGYPEHILFKVAGLVPAGLELLTGATGWVPALCFAVVSTWVLWLIARVARAGGGSEAEALVALVLAACTTSLFYYARHLLPYDLALAFLLLGLRAALQADGSRRSSFRTGLWSGLGFLTYNGYWTLAALVPLLHIARGWPQGRDMATRTTFTLLGLTTPILLIAAASRPAGHDFFALVLAFTGTVNQGDLGQAWLFVPQYLWTAEHGLLVLWIAGLLLALDQGDAAGSRRLLFWPAFLLTLAALLIVPSDVWNRFALSARHVRVLSPFLCLAAAAALCANPWLRARPRVFAGLLGLVALQAAFNFATPLTQLFPREFNRLAVARLAAARQSDLGPYRIVNGSFLHNPGLAPAGPDPGTVLLRRPHPFQFDPYLFEGYPAMTRDLYRERDLSMRLVRLAVGGPPQGGYPAALLELELRFPAEPFGLLPEPLLSTGRPGRGDTIFLDYKGRDRLRIGHDHIGGGARLSPTLPLDRSRTHRVLVGLGSLYPAGSGPLQSRLFVLWDDMVALSGPAELHPTLAAEITIGHNFIGTSTALPQLSAEIVGFRRLALPARGTVFSAPPGRLQLDLLLPASPDAVYAEPLLSSGLPGRGELLFLRSEGGGRFRLGLDRWGHELTLSEPFTLDLSRQLKVVTALGSFLPPAADGSTSRELYAAVNGQVIFNRQLSFLPAAAATLALGENRIASTAASGSQVQILRCEPAATPPTADPTGAIRLKLRFFTPPAPGEAQPLLSTGQTGAGDLLFIRFDERGRFQIGHDHWGHAATLSAPQPFNPAEPLELTITARGLLAPGKADTSSQRDRLLVATGDRVILDQPARFHPVPAGTLAVGWNRIGASTAVELLAADVLDYAPVSPDTIPTSTDRR